MREEVKFLLDNHRVRKSKKQKAAFREWLCATLESAGYKPTVEMCGFNLSSNNVVVGDIHTAKVIFTAHYDTPARMPYPNFIVPHSILWTLICQLPLMLMMFIPPVALEIVFILLGAERSVAALAFVLALYGMLALMLVGPANPSNVNDNSSGVATLLEVALSLPEGARDGVVFVFFDNEEKGLLGSSGFYKTHKQAVKDTLVVNFDCVADGDYIRFFPTSKLKKREDLMTALGDSFESAGEKEVTVTRGFGYYPSDQKHFPLGVGCAALHKKPLIGYCLGRIHTSRDTVYEQENIDILRRGSLRLAEKICASEKVEG